MNCFGRRWVPLRSFTLWRTNPSHGLTPVSSNAEPPEVLLSHTPCVTMKPGNAPGFVVSNPSTPNPIPLWPSN